MKEVRIIIAGGRDFEDYDLLERNVSKIITNKREYMKKERIYEK